MKIRSYICHTALLLLASAASVAQPVADTANLRDHVLSLCQLDPPRSVRCLPSLDFASRYVQAQLRRFSSRIVLQEYQVPEGGVRNIIASFGPESGSRIVVGAHYDVAGFQPGADDNASGVAGLIELARMLSTDSAAIRSRIDLVAYTLEEPPYFRTERMGSFVHAKSLKDHNVDVLFMLSLEMIGYFTDEEDSQSYPSIILGWFYPSVGNFVAVIANFASHYICGDFVGAMRKGCSIRVERLTAPSCITGVDFSDHLNYWDEGFKALMITDTSFLRNQHYHDSSDTPETLDFIRMAQVVNGVYHALISLNP